MNANNIDIYSVFDDLLDFGNKNIGFINSIDEIDVNDENKHVPKPFTDAELKKMSSDISTFQSPAFTSSSFDYGKTNITISASKKKGRGRNVKPIQEFKKKTKVDELRSRVQTIVNMFIFICYLLGETLFWILFHWLTGTSTGWAIILQCVRFILKDSHHIWFDGERLKKQRFIASLWDILNLETVDADLALLAKDKVLLSDKKYMSLRKDMKLIYVSPPLKQIIARRMYWNEQAVKEFDLQSEGDRFQVSLRKVMVQLAKEARLRKQIPADNTFKVKITLDGRKGCPWANVIIAMVPLNLKAYKTQDVESVFVLCGYKGKEKPEVIKENTKLLQKELKELQANGFYENGQHYKFNALWSSDLKALWAISNVPCGEFCPFCNVKISRRHLLETVCLRPIQNIFGISDLKICTLHAKQRIVEKLLKCLTFNNQLLVEELNKIIANDLKIARVRLTIDDVRGDADIGYVDSSMISGHNADRITRKGEELVEKLKNAANTLKTNGLLDATVVESIDWESCKLIWKQWYMIWRYMEAKSEELKKLELQSLKVVLFQWFNRIKETFGAHNINYYIHILTYHLADLLDKGSLCPVSNQGLENRHNRDKEIERRGTSHGGGEDRVNPMMQILLRHYRMLLLRIYKFENEMEQ